MKWLSNVGVAIALVGAALTHETTLLAQSSCGPTINPIVCENQKAGAPSSEWDISGAGDNTIQGFSTSISVTPGQTESFKIDTNANSYTIDIYRMGYYGGMGARKVASISPSAHLPQSQPSCLSNAATGLIDCGNWAVSASWTVPADAVSGIYFALLTRIDSGGQSHIFFIVREVDTAPQHSDLVFQTSDTTWQAYNQYGGNSLYVGGPGVNPGRAYKVSYNRPFTTRGTGAQDFVFNAEYPMVRWLEANGYYVSYISGVDTDQSGPTILTPTKHKVFLSVGHDEYWSGPQRANIEAARAAGLHLAFFSGNEMFWKTRWENSIDGSGTPYRTLVAYKETHANAVIDPADPPTWTGTWRDPRFSPPADGGRPENAVTGTIFKVNSGTAAITVPAALGKVRFWRNTSVATLPANGTATFTAGTLGYEWDEEPNNGFRPSGLMHLSSTTVSVAQMLLDYGSTYGPGTATNNTTLYRHPSGALVFGAGSVQWSWGLDSHHDLGSAAADVRMEQGTVNLFADMGAQPATLQSGLTPATASTDTLAPTSVISSPTSGASIAAGTLVTISGTATDAGGGIVMGVEVSTNGGVTWSQATGTTSWTFSWTAAGSGSVNIKSRAFDDSGNMEVPSSGVTITVPVQVCPCSIWSSATVPPAPLDEGDPGAVELGTRFQADAAGYITGVRFYKVSTNTGTHVGNLWSSTGTLLATATFTGESASGWQQVNFASPIAINANTVYIVSYHAPNGHYTGTGGFFANSVDNPPLHALRDGASGANGVYTYGSSSVFPSSTFNSENYWADVVFNTTVSDTTPPTITSTAPANGATGVAPTATITANFSEAMTASTISSSTFQLMDPGNNLVAATVSYVAATNSATLQPTSSLAFSTTYTAVVRGGSTDPRVKDLAGNAMAANATWSFTTAASAPPPPSCPCTIWSPSATPQNADDGDPSAVELGVRFRSDAAGFVTGVRFYKGTTANGGTHVGNLWTNTGTLLGTVTFGSETSTGWQQANFSSPIAIAASTTYVISYHTSAGHYSSSPGYFAGGGVDSPPLHALKDGTDGSNGVYTYGASSAFPTQTYQSELDWVDVVFNTTIGPTWTISGTISPVSGGAGATVTLSGAASKTATADGSGNYSFTGLQNGSYTVTPAHTGFTFTPATSVVPINGANGTANFTAQSVPTFSISGAITPSASGAGATLTLSGAASGTATADPSGNYSFSGLANGTYTVTPSKSTFAFTPPSQSVTISGTNMTANFTAQAAPPGIVIDATLSTARSTSSTTIATAAFSTTTPNELLLAFVAADNNSGTTTVSGVATTGLTWQLVKRTNTQRGTSEIWRTFAAAALTNVTATATLSQSVAASLTVMSFKGVDTSGTSGSGAIGAIASNNANPGAPTATLMTTRANSFVVGVGNDWDNAIVRTLGPGQTPVQQYLSTGGDTYWVQRTTNPVAASGTSVTINDTAPATDRYNLTICEVLIAP